VKKKLRLYIDTSVFGGCFDQEFMPESKRIIEYSKKKKVTFLISAIVAAELESAPERVQVLVESIPEGSLEVLSHSDAVIDLASAYIAAKIVTKKSFNDAMHVAHATAARADAIVSWNFKHIVRLDRMKGYNKINLENGYGFLQIISPKEVILDE
jgi:predicted nucleic acid-binding protein